MILRHRALACALACATLAAVRTGADASVAIGPGSIVASVRDSAGHPVSGALVVANGPTTREALTTVGGVVTLQALPLGSYSVIVTRVGYAPTGTEVRLAERRGGPTVVAMRIAPASFTDLHGGGNTVDVIELASSVDAFVSRVIDRAAPIALVPVPGGSGAAPTLLGTSPNETRVELDGIPLAGGATGLAALRFRSALALSEIQLVRGAAAASSTPRGAIGGAIDYRTPDLDGPAKLGAMAGYASSFGAFQRVLARETFGKFKLLTDVVAGGGENRSQTLKIRYAASPLATLGYAQYGSQSRSSIAGRTVVANDPAFAADLHAKLGATSLDARAFGSSSEVVTSTLGVASGFLAEDVRTHGTQIRYAMPSGESLFTIDFDRRTDDGSALSRTYATLSARADLALSPTARIEFGDAYGGGSALASRHDPHVALAIRTAPHSTLRISAASAYATAPNALVARAGAAVATTAAPETSFVYRVGFERALASSDRVWISLDALRRYDRFATYANARSEAVEFGYERATLPGRIGGLAYAFFQRETAYGPLQPFARIDDARGAALVTRHGRVESDPFAGDPSTKARLALAYSDVSGSLDLGATYYGVGNAFASHAVVLADAGARTTLGRLVDISLGIDNIFGTIASDPRLRSFYLPRELTVTVGRIR